MYCYGRLPPHPLPVRDLTHYLKSPLPSPPTTVQAPALEYPMAGNDTYGDCVIAGVVHTDQATAALTNETWGYPGDNYVKAEYFDLTGGEDTGLVETYALQVWQRRGLFGKKLAAFAPVNPKHTIPVRQTVALCGACFMGVLMPAPAQDQFQEGRPWRLTRTPADSDIVGGHCVVYVGYNQTGPIAVTWGKLQQVAWEWHLAYAEEAYAVITQEVKDRGSLRGLDFAKLETDLAVLRVA